MSSRSNSSRTVLVVTLNLIGRSRTVLVVRLIVIGRSCIVLLVRLSLVGRSRTVLVVRLIVIGWSDNQQSIVFTTFVVVALAALYKNMK